MKRRQLHYVLASLALLAAACFTLLPAGAWKWLACENEGSEACGRKALADAQFVVACVGIAPAMLLVWDTIRGNHRTLLWRGAGLAVYVAWAVLLDAALHGWDDLKLVPFEL
jgi:hypothetical protein